MAASDNVPILLKNRLHLAGRPQMSTLAVSRLAPDDESAVGIDRRSGRDHRAQEPRTAWRRPSTPARSIRTNCSGASAMSGAWGSHRPNNGAADLGCAIQSIAALGEVCGATAFMAWCQNTLVWYAANSANPALNARFRRHVRQRADARRHRAFQSDEDLLRDREDEAEGPQGRRRLHRQRRAALGVQSRPRPFLRHHFRARGRSPARS